VLLLGHTGYIGSRLFLALQVGSRVPVIGRSVTDLDLTRSESVAALESLVDVDTCVVICAAIKKQLGDTADVLAQNLVISLNIGNALAARPARRIVFFSSAAVYGEDLHHEEHITEETRVEPTSYYGIGKFAAERLLHRMAGGCRDTSMLILRPALVYGPKEPRYYYGPSGFLRKALLREPITLWGDGEELREFLYIEDVVNVVKRLTFSNIFGVLNIISGTSYTYRQALDEITALLGEAPAVTSRPRTRGKVDHRFDAKALRAAVPGFEFTTLAAGLRLIGQAGIAATEGTFA
jgi:UDP-glucose 4-epimerase